MFYLVRYDLEAFLLSAASGASTFPAFKSHIPSRCAPSRPDCTTIDGAYKTMPVDAPYRCIF